LPYGLNMSGGGPDLDGAAKRANHRSTCCMDSTGPAVDRILTDRLQWMEASVEARLGSVKAAVMARSEAPVVPGFDPLDQW
jgi:hypothetical protein